jgi:VWFA-related protein
MHIIRLIAVVVLAIAFPIHPLEAQDFRATSITVPFISAIEIDGHLREWDTAAPLELASEGLVRGGGWKGVADLSGRVWIAWDRSAFSFAADLRDDDFLGILPGRPIWECDSLVLTLSFPGANGGGPLFYLMISSAGDEPEFAMLRADDGGFVRYATPSLRVAVRTREALGPVVEGSVDWTDLLGEDAVAPVNFRFNAEVRDADSGGRIKSISWLPASVAARTNPDLGLAVLLRPSEMEGMIGQRNTADHTEYVQLIQIPVVVTDATNNYVRDLGSADFRITENGVPQQIDELTFETRPITVGLLIDASGSMERNIATARTAATDFLDALREEDRAFVVAFNHNIELLKDFDGGIDQAKEAIDQIRAEGGTMLYGSLYFAMRKMDFLREKKVLVLLSDGKDESQGLQNPYGEELSMHMIIEEARRREVSVYAIAFRLGDSGALSELGLLTQRTGGRLFTPSTAEGLISAYEDIARELKSQYLLSYISNNRSWDGLWRTIQVQVIGREYQVRTREGYYAPKR